MKTRIIRIGNSQGVRIPKILLERSHLTEEVEIEAENGQIVIRPVRQPRQGWAGAFQAMAQHDDDKLLDDDQLTPTQWDEEEWQW